MRFKSKLAPEQIQILTSLITPISRMNGGDNAANNPLKSGASMIGGSVVHIDQQYIRFSARGGNTGSASSDADGISCYVELACDVIFLDHKIESAANNAILFDINLAQLRTALQSVLSSIRGGRHQSSTIPSLQHSLDDTFHDEDGPFSGFAAATEVTFQSTLAVIKLAKRNGLPCLCLDCSGGSTSSMEVHHAIPVKVMRVAEMQYHLPPRIPNPDVQLELPIDRPIRTVVERLKLMSPHIYIEGCMAGELSFSIDGDGVSVRTYYNRLVPRFEECKASKEYHDNDGQVVEDDTSVRCTLKVDSKKFLSCLQWQSLLGRTIIHSAIICMVENEMLVLHVLLNPRSLGFFTYYVPVHFLSPDQLD